MGIGQHCKNFSIVGNENIFSFCKPQIFIKILL
nr:MAG TPA: hypothetical protein [Caudoviricetes sp.]